MIKNLVIVIAFVLCCTDGSAQAVNLSKDNLQASMSTFEILKAEGTTMVRVVMDSSVKLADEPVFAKIRNVQFKDGTIELRVKSKFLPDAPSFARGFIGVAFRINADNSQFESIYIRPDNGRNEDQVRRNHSVQYFAFPDFKFDRMRKEFPEKYEAYADMGMNEWIKLKIVVKGQQARLYVNGSQQPTLIVNDLKNGPDSSGAIGLWVGQGTEGYFADLKISK